MNAEINLTRSGRGAEEKLNAKRLTSLTGLRKVV
jgi:hypothetical protein